MTPIPAGLDRVAELVRNNCPDLAFTVLEIGARPVDAVSEPFYLLPSLFPSSRIIGFEIGDEEVCRAMNEHAQAGFEFCNTGLARESGERTLYETQHPMCSSLYKPNESFLSLYNNLEVALIKGTHTVTVKSLDDFCASHAIALVDFVKIDVQGAELEIFEGGESCLSNCAAIVCEVEFVPLYCNQPLFGDVSAFLSTHGLMFHKFLGLAGRTFKPYVLNGDINFASQHMWSDAFYIRHPESFGDAPRTMLHKLALLAFMYGSIDVTAYVLATIDKREGTALQHEFLELFSQK